MRAGFDIDAGCEYAYNSNNRGAKFFAEDVAFKSLLTAQTIPRRELIVRSYEGRSQLPIVELRRAA